MKIKKGFTLAEVMVTLGIMGILAAIAIPVVMSIAPNTNKVMLKKAYSVFEKTVSDLINDDTLYPSSQVSGTTVRGFNYTDDWSAAGAPSANAKFCYLFSQDVNVVGAVDCASQPGKFTTADGIDWYVYQNSFPLNSTSYNAVLVDVNGSKAPNCQRSDTYGTDCPASVQIPDRFIIGARYDGRISIDTTASTADIDAGTILTDPTNNKKD